MTRKVRDIWIVGGCVAIVLAALVVVPLVLYAMAVRARSDHDGQVLAWVVAITVVAVVVASVVIGTTWLIARRAGNRNS